MELLYVAFPPAPVVESVRTFNAVLPMTYAPTAAVSKVMPSILRPASMTIGLPEPPMPPESAELNDDGGRNESEKTAGMEEAVGGGFYESRSGEMAANHLIGSSRAIERFFKSCPQSPNRVNS